jgi:C-terminal processing protease CtpA/Prc
MEVLRRFKVTFDYSRSRIHLEPNRAFAEPFVYDASGLRLRAARPAFSPPYVASVVASSPAEQAGLQPNDVLLEIDGRSTAGMSLEGIRETLRQPGKQHRLILSRGETTIKTALRTRELLN